MDTLVIQRKWYEYLFSSSFFPSQKQEGQTTNASFLFNHSTTFTNTNKNDNQCHRIKLTQNQFGKEIHKCVYIFAQKKCSDIYSYSYMTETVRKRIHSAIDSSYPERTSIVTFSSDTFAGSSKVSCVDTSQMAAKETVIKSSDGGFFLPSCFLFHEREENATKTSFSLWDTKKGKTL